jgi:CHAT domain-containing protein/tetratricopeptide (TPR) repeat protein
MAAEAQLIKANMLDFFMIDVRRSLDAARGSAAAYAALGESAKLQTARARLMVARALADLAVNPMAKNPTMQEANVEARAIVGELSGPDSPFGPIERARALDVSGTIDLGDARVDDAKKRFEEANAVYAAVGYVAGEAEMQAQLAHVFVVRGDWEQAARAFAAVLPNVKKIVDPKRRIGTLINSAHALGFSGRTDQAMAILLEAVAGAREYKLRAFEGEASWELAQLYWFRGDYLQAKALFAQTLKIARELDNDLGLTSTLGTYGMVARHDGDYAAAIEMHEEAKQLAGNPFQRIRMMRQLALDHAAAGQHAEAMAELRAALEVDVQDPRHHIFTDVKRDLAEALIEHGDGASSTLREAAALLEASMQMALQRSDVQNQIGGHRVRAALLARQGMYPAARAEFERAFALTFKYRGATANPQLRMQSLEHEQLAFRGYFDLMMRDVAADGASASRPVPAEAEDALRMLERARETHFGLRAAELDSTTRERIDALLAQMADRSVKISSMLTHAPDAQQTAELDTLQGELSSLRSELDRERTAAAARQTANEKPAAVKARSWRKTDPRAAQLSYALGNRHAYVWVRTAAGLRAVVLPESPEAIERELRDLAAGDARHSPLKIEQSLQRISALLLPAGLVPPDSNSLEIIAEGRIATVPFAGLRSPATRDRHLIETHVITLITSMYAVDELPQPKYPRPFRLVALASGTGTLRSAPVANPLPQLQAATAEIQAIADLFTARASGAKVKLFAGHGGNAEELRRMWSNGADVVHFATHALADLRQPLASLLVLPAQDASGKPAYLTAGQVQEWRGDADLVFLSACESAIGPPRFAGGMPGLQSAFLRAGARGVIATLWPIEDILAREFSADFYRHYTSGVSAAQALSEVQRAWLVPKAGVGASSSARRRMTAMAHGFYTH